MTRRGDWMQTYTGKQFFPLDPHVDDISIVDIAHALAHICRYNGHVNEHYSVAQHSLIIARYVPDEFKLVALLHDATEAYVGDMVRPLKRSMPEYRQVEDHLAAIIDEKFKLGGQLVELPACVKEADSLILGDERASFFPGKPPASWNEKGRLGVTIVSRTPREARADFLDRYVTLTKEYTTEIQKARMAW